MSDNFPDGLLALFDAHKVARPFWGRVRYWISMRAHGFRVTWAGTRWMYPTLHGTSTERYPNWRGTDSTGANPGSSRLL